VNFLKLSVLLLLCIACAAKAPSSAEKDRLKSKEINLLFIGNSLTYTNDLPTLVKKIAKKKGFKVNTKMIAQPNYALMDHWDEGKIQTEIRSKKYDYVIVQQGPSSQDYGRKILLEYGEKLTELCRANNAQFSYFMVWPSRRYYHTFDKVIKNHEDAARLHKVVLCPVGAVWKAHFDATNAFDYYGPDGFHPSLKGSTVAAEVIVESLFVKK